MPETKNIIIIEERTGDLYSNCFSKLNAIDDNWHSQEKLLSQQLGLNEDNVKGKICLDGGCGPGTLTRKLLKLGAKEVYGLDLNPTPREDMFKGLSNAHFIKASLLNMPFENNTFDLVASTGVLHHTADPEKGLAEMVRVLRPGGYLRLGVYGKHGLFSWCLSLMRLVTVKYPIISKKFTEKALQLLKINPLLSYQILDYGYVPCLYRFSPKQLAMLFIKYGLEKPERIFNVNSEEAKEFRENKTVYTYDPRAFKSKILFGYGFISMVARKK